MKTKPPLNFISIEEMVCLVLFSLAIAFGCGAILAYAHTNDQRAACAYNVGVWSKQQDICITISSTPEARK